MILSPKPLKIVVMLYSTLYWTKGLFAPYIVNRPPFETTDAYVTGLHCESKKGATLSMAITLSILDRFPKFFHCCKEQ